MVVITDEEIKAQAEAQRKAKFDAMRNEVLREKIKQLTEERANRHQAIKGLESIQEYSGVNGL